MSIARASIQISETGKPSRVGARRSSRNKIALGLTLLLAFAISAAGCGGGSETLHVYSSFPLVGEYRVQSEDIIRGERLALRRIGGKVGDFKIKLISMNDGSSALGQWDPEQVTINARNAIKDKKTIAYIGESNSGASGVAIPLLNEADILQVSPVSTYVGLTRSQGAARGEPEKYYPTGRRTFGRIVPADHIQADATATLMQEQKCGSLYILNDGGIFGKGIASLVKQEAVKIGVDVKRNASIDLHAKDFKGSADRVRSSGASCFYFGGDSLSQAVKVFNDVYHENPGIKVFGSDGLADSQFVSGLKSEQLQSQTFITTPTLDQPLYPPEAAWFYREFRLHYGKDPEPYAIYGYEAMSAVLDAIERAGDKANDRSAVVKAFLSIKNRKSVLGVYSIDPNGDTTLRDYGVYRVQNGKLVFDKVILAKT